MGGRLMARIRSIKPSFFKSDDVAALPLRARLTWIGLWTQCDDQGRTKDHARLIKADIWPLDNVSLADIEEDLTTLAARGRIVRYEVDGQRYLEIVNWDVHQSINRPTPSRIPPAPSVNGHVPLTESVHRPSPIGTDTPEVIHREGLRDDSVSTHTRKGREGKGREGARAREAPTDLGSEPPSRCEKHLRTTKPPACGACADARREHGRWEAERNKRLATAPKCRLHRGQPAEHCAICRSEELSPA